MKISSFLRSSILPTKLFITQMLSYCDDRKKHHRKTDNGDPLTLIAPSGLRCWRSLSVKHTRAMVLMYSLFALHSLRHCDAYMRRRTETSVASAPSLGLIKCRFLSILSGTVVSDNLIESPTFLCRTWNWKLCFQNDVHFIQTPMCWDQLPPVCSLAYCTSSKN